MFFSEREKSFCLPTFIKVWPSWIEFLIYTVCLLFHLALWNKSNECGPTFICEVLCQLMIYLMRNYFIITKLAFVFVKTILIGVKNCFTKTLFEYLKTLGMFSTIVQCIISNAIWNFSYKFRKIKISNIE